LRNRLGLRRKREMDAAEYEALLRAQESYLQRISADTRFTAALLREMHRDWLGELYEWAGQYRTVELSKGGFRWPPAHLVADNMARFEAGLLREHTPCRPAPLPEVARRIAEVHAELLLIHPFREGNGRLARWLVDLMALQASFSVPDYGFAGRGSKGQQRRYLEAVKRGYLQDYDDLVDFFREAIERRLRALG
jgi:cell filamentation protein